MWQTPSINDHLIGDAAAGPYPSEQDVPCAEKVQLALSVSAHLVGFLAPCYWPMLLSPKFLMTGPWPVVYCLVVSGTRPSALLGIVSLQFSRCV